MSGSHGLSDDLVRKKVKVVLQGDIQQADADGMTWLDNVSIFLFCLVSFFSVFSIGHVSANGESNLLSLS